MNNSPEANDSEDDGPGPLTKRLARLTVAEDFIQGVMPVALEPSGDPDFIERNRLAFLMYQSWRQVERGKIVADPRMSPEPMCAFQQTQNQKIRNYIGIAKKDDIESKIEWCLPSEKTQEKRYLPLQSCPQSPRCGPHCRWAEKRLILVMAWRFRKVWQNIPESVVRLIISYARDHAKATALDLPSGAWLRIDRGFKVDEFAYHDPASLVCELWAFTTGKLDEFQVLRCNISRMIDSNPELFWSALLNYKASGALKTIAPFRYGRDRYFENTPIGTAILRLQNEIEGQRQNQVVGDRIHVETTSGFAHLFCQYEGSLPPDLRNSDGDSFIEEWPRWWRIIAKPWNHVFDRFLSEANYVPCYFIASELGCVAQQMGRECNSDHDPFFINWVHDSISRPFSCLRCSAYADKLRCSTCKRYYCSRACSRQDWREHKSKCGTFLMAHETALHPDHIKD